MSDEVVDLAGENEHGLLLEQQPTERLAVGNVSQRLDLPLRALR